MFCVLRMYLAAIFQHAVCEAAIAFSSDLNVVGALQQHSLLQVARSLVHVGDAVLAVVGDVLGSVCGQQPQESQLDVGAVAWLVIISIAEL